MDASDPAFLSSSITVNYINGSEVGVFTYKDQVPRPPVRDDSLWVVTYGLDM
jgi:hypothetical protein